MVCRLVNHPAVEGGDAGVFTRFSTDPADDSSVGGEVGQASLEETDVKALPFSAEAQQPSVSRKHLGTDAPSDLKE